MGYRHGAALLFLTALAGCPKQPARHGTVRGQQLDAGMVHAPPEEVAALLQYLPKTTGFMIGYSFALGLPKTQVAFDIWDVVGLGAERRDPVMACLLETGAITRIAVAQAPGAPPDGGRHAPRVFAIVLGSFEENQVIACALRSDEVQIQERADRRIYAAGKDPALVITLPRDGVALIAEPAWVRAVLDGSQGATARDAALAVTLARVDLTRDQWFAMTDVPGFGTTRFAEAWGSFEERPGPQTFGIDAFARVPGAASARGEAAELTSDLAKNPAFGEVAVSAESDVIHVRLAVTWSQAFDVVFGPGHK